MATITGLTAARMLAIEAETVVSGEIVGTNLILTQHDGTDIDAGDVSAAVPQSSVTVQGKVELATTTEAVTGTDTGRAVTPAGVTAVFASKILASNALAESALLTAYPTGISFMPLASGSSWSLNSGLGAAVTNYITTDLGQQTFYASVGGSTSLPLAWVRTYRTSGGWTGWQQVALQNNLVPGSFAQTTAATSYPFGTSRIYYTTANSGSWDFTGKAGEVVTFRDSATDFTRQQWTKHQGGTSANTELWLRTSNTASGWSSWETIGGDTGWINITYASGYNATGIAQLQYRVKGGVVYFRGGANGTFTSATFMTIASAGAVPAAYCPSQAVRGGASGAAARPAVFGILTDGSIVAGSGGLSSQPTTVEFCANYPTTAT